MNMLPDNTEIKRRIRVVYNTSSKEIENIVEKLALTEKGQTVTFTSQEGNIIGVLITAAVLLRHE